jgi:hypothetical protein
MRRKKSSEPEEWRPIPGYDGYEVSNLGRVRSKKKYGWKILKGCGQRALKQLPNGDIVRAKKISTVTVMLRDKSGPRRFQVHRLVLLAFRGPPPPGKIGCHWDDVPTNNRLSNLRWDTYAANMADARRNGLMVRPEAR